MENLFSEIPAESAGLLTLGVALGENAAFCVVSGRTAAAQAACLQRVREEKLFQALEPTWEQFCPKYLRISRAEADRTIRLWEEFVDGEAIELNAENSRRVADAVSRLRRAIPGRTAAQKKPRELDGLDLIEDLRLRSIAFVQEFEANRDGKDAGNERKAFYNDLPPRNYRFRVAACNNSGVWNEAGAFLDFGIDPAYYQTTRFRLLSCVKKYKPGPR
jgi:hypothetical protein